MGPAFYQRLRHMVADKVHARSTGPMQVLTRQPVEGRSKRGGLRLGEMERDCIIAHGASAVLEDRLLHASDFYVMPVCELCGQIADNVHNDVFDDDAADGESKATPYCRACKTDRVLMVQTPYAYKLLVQELNAVGLSVRHSVTETP